MTRSQEGLWHTFIQRDAWECSAGSSGSAQLPFEQKIKVPPPELEQGIPGFCIPALRDLESYTSELAQQQETEMIRVNWEWSRAGSEPCEAPDFFHLGSDSSSLVLCPCTHTESVVAGHSPTVLPLELVPSMATG